MIFLNDNDEKDISTTHMPDARKAASKNKAIAKRMMRKEVASDIIATLPAIGESFECITNGQSNAGGFYEVIRDRWGKVDELCIATWIMNRDYINMLFDDLDNNRLGSLVFIISNRMQQLGKGHAPAFNVLKSKAIEHPRVKFRVANSHAKVFSMTNGIDYITVSGSGNWSENPRIENYCITNDKTKFDFHKKWMIELCQS
jgi:hypothetical protein